MPKFAKWIEGVTDIDDPDYVNYSPSGHVLVYEPSTLTRKEAMSERKLKNNIKRMHYHVLMTAIRNVKSSYHLTLLKAINFQRMSQSDIDTVNYFAFGDMKGVKIEVKDLPALSSCTQKNIEIEIIKKEMMFGFF